ARPERSPEGEGRSLSPGRAAARCGGAVALVEGICATRGDKGAGLLGAQTPGAAPGQCPATADGPATHTIVRSDGPLRYSMGYPTGPSSASGAFTLALTSRLRAV